MHMSVCTQVEGKEKKMKNVHFKMQCLFQKKVCKKKTKKWMEGEGERERREEQGKWIKMCKEKMKEKRLKEWYIKKKEKMSKGKKKEKNI